MRPRGGRRSSGYISILQLAIASICGLPDSVRGAAPGEPGAASVEYTRTSWTEKDGLPSNMVNAMAQDREGYLWLGTTGGLVRFDGVTFTPWVSEATRSLLDREVTALCVDHEGALWIGFRAGGATRISDGKLFSFSQSDGLPEGRVGALLEDRDGTVWAGGRGGLSRFRNNRWERIGSAQGFLPQTVRTLYEDRAGSIWVGTSSNIFVSRNGGARFERLLSEGRIHGFSEDRAGAMWVTDSNRAFRRLGQPDSEPVLVSEGESGYALLHDRHGVLWVGTRGDGVVRVIHPGKPSAPIVERFTVADGLASDVVESLLEDREGNIWVGTQAGLTRFSEGWITSIPLAGGRRSIIRGLTVGRDGAVWASTHGGLLRFLKRRRQMFTARDGLPSTDVTVVQEDRDGVLWVATDRGLARYANGRFSPVPVSGDVRWSWIISMAFGRDGVLWLCDTDGGLFQLRKGTLSALDVSEFGRKLAVVTYADRRGGVWLGFEDGGVALSRDGTLRIYSQKDGLASGRVNAILEDAAGVVWIGTNTGLSRFREGRFTTLAHRDRLSVNAITAIVSDEEGYLWIASTSGIVRLHPAEYEFALAEPSYRLRYDAYDASDGLGGMPILFNHPTAVRAGDGTLWFVTDNGISIVNPKDRPENRPLPPARIEAITADDQSFGPRASLRLSALTSRMQIQYNAVTLSVSTGIRFRYMLEGLDPHWVDAGHSRQASYTNVPPGVYRFRVMTGNRDGVWNEPGATWEFSLEPRFYQTRWFYGFCALMALVLLAAAWQLRVRTLHHQFALVSAERARLAREIHDTLLQSLVGVALQFNFMFRQFDTSPASVKQQLDRVRKQVDRYVREARQSIWDLRLPAIERGDLVSALRDIGESLTANGRVSFEFVVQGQPRRCARKLEEQLLRIGSEAVSNAVRHAEPTTVRVELRYEHDTVLLRISDDGRGFDPEDARKTDGHWGLMSMQERAKLIGAQLTLASHPGGGTRLETVAPFSPA